LALAGLRWQGNVQGCTLRRSHRIGVRAQILKQCTDERNAELANRREVYAYGIRETVTIQTAIDDGSIDQPRVENHDLRCHLWYGCVNRLFATPTGRGAASTRALPPMAETVPYPFIFLDGQYPRLLYDTTLRFTCRARPR
jgi:hypothetical protein